MKKYILSYLLKWLIRGVGFSLFLVSSQIVAFVSLVGWWLEIFSSASTSIELISAIWAILFTGTTMTSFTYLITDVWFPEPEFDIEWVFMNRTTVTKRELQWIKLLCPVRLYPSEYRPGLDRHVNHGKCLAIAGDVVWAYTGREWLVVSRFVLDEKQKRRMLADGNT